MCLFCITLGKPPHIKQPVYGGRALDFVFDLNEEDFDLASFFGEQPVVSFLLYIFERFDEAYCQHKNPVSKI